MVPDLSTTNKVCSITLEDERSVSFLPGCSGCGGGGGGAILDFFLVGFGRMGEEGSASKHSGVGLEHLCNGSPPFPYGNQNLWSYCRRKSGEGVVVLLN